MGRQGIVISSMPCEQFTKYKAVLLFSSLLKRRGDTGLDVSYAECEEERAPGGLVSRSRSTAFSNRPLQ